MKGTPERRPRWLNRRRLYTGGALMLLAPVGAGCEVDKKDKDVLTIVPADVLEAKDGYDVPDQVPPIDTASEDLKDLPVIYIAPMDVDNGMPEVIAIAPFDPGQDIPEAIAIAPFDPGPDKPEAIFIAPVDPGPDVPEVIFIAPVDSGPDVGPGKPCEIEGEWCSDDLMCQAQAICIVPTECCGGCECQPKVCYLSNPMCPPDSVCVPDDDKKGHCVRKDTVPPGGYMVKCETDQDCLQEYFCEQTMFCIAPPPPGDKKPAFCGEKNCVPIPCTNTIDSSCPLNSKCVPYVISFPMDMPLLPEPKNAVWTCVRDVGKVPGGFGYGCNNSKDCIANQYYCSNPPEVLCILPCEFCGPIPCDPVKPVCPPDGVCTDVGIGSVCVRKS